MKIEVKEMETGLRVLAMEINAYVYKGSLLQPIYEKGLDGILVIYVKKGEKGGSDESQGS